MTQDPLVQALLALQFFEGLTDPAKPDGSYHVKLAKLRAALPVSILMHHYHRRNRKKLSIARPTASGACGHCFIAVPRGLILQMSRTGSLVSCPQCDGFLYVEMGEQPQEEPAKKPKRTRAAAAA